MIEPRHASRTPRSTRPGLPTESMSMISKGQALLVAAEGASPEESGKLAEQAQSLFDKVAYNEKKRLGKGDQDGMDKLSTFMGAVGDYRPKTRAEIEENKNRLEVLTAKGSGYSLGRTTRAEYEKLQAKVKLTPKDPSLL